MPLSPPRPVTPRQVKHWRLAHDLTIPDAAALVAISDRQWSRYENRRAPIPGWLARLVREGDPR
jgi:transcriptional regulator with XRE-family HTH domain